MKKILSFMLVLSMLFSMVSFAIPAAVVVESAAEIADIAELASDDTATLSGEYGEVLVAGASFENKNDGDTMAQDWNAFFDTNTNLATYLGHKTPYWYPNGNASVIKDVNGNKVLQMTLDSDNDKFFIQPRCTNTDATRKVTPGTYTMVAKVTIPEGSTVTAVNGYLAGTNSFSGQPYYVTPDFAVSAGGETVVTQTVTFAEGESRFYGWGLNVKAKDTSNMIIYVDDVEIWYGEPEVEEEEVVSVVTFDANGVDAQVPAAVNGVVGTAIDLAGYEATTEDETKTFKGWATAADGEVVTTFTPSEAAHTLYAIWETVEVEEPETPEAQYPASGVVFFEDFEDATITGTPEEIFLAEAGVLNPFVYPHKDFYGYAPKFQNTGTNWYKTGTVGNFYYAEVNGNKVAKMDGGNWRYAGVSFCEVGYGMIIPGTYTLSYDIICDGSVVSAPAWDSNSYPYSTTHVEYFVFSSANNSSITPNGLHFTTTWTINPGDNDLETPSYTKYAGRLATHFNAGAGTYIAVDNVKLEYQAPVTVVPATVTFDANGVDATVPSAIETTVGETVDLADVVATTDDETKNFLGWATTATGEIITSLEVSEVAHTLYAIWETIEVEEPETQYPESGVIFNVTFEDMAVGTTEFFLGEAGVLEGFVSDANKNYRPKASNSATDWYKPGVASTQYTLVEENGNKFMKKTDGLTWQYFGVSFAEAGWGIITPGTYTLSFDVICDGRAISNAAYNKNSFPYMASGSPDYITYTTTANDMTPNGRTVTVTWTIGPDDNAESVTKHAGRLVQQFNAEQKVDGVNVTTYVGVDNIKLVYEAPITVVPATVTFDANGVAATVPDAITTTTGTEINLSDYVATTTDASKKFAGWATSANGEVITTFVPTEATSTLYAIWEEVVVITDGYVVDMDFEGSTVGDVLLTAPGSTVAWKGAHNKALAKYREVIGSTSAQNGFSGALLENDVIITQLSDGNKVMNFNCGDDWNQYMIRTPDFRLAGTYTISFKYMVPNDSNVGTVGFYSTYNTKLNDGNVSFVYAYNGGYTKGEWYTHTVKVKVGEGGISELSAFKIQLKGAGDFYLDDIKYYYETPKEPSVVTFATTNPAITVPAAIESGIGGRVDLSFFVPTVNDSTLKFKGWSTTQDATGLITNDIFTPTAAAHTLYAITEAAALVHPYFSTEFNEGDKVIFADGKGEVQNKVQYYKTHTVVDGVLRTTFTDADTDETTGKGTWIPDPIQQHIYVTNDTPLVKDDIKGVAVAYKINDTVYNGDWTGNSIGVNNDYNNADLFFGAAGSSDSGLIRLGDVWQYDGRNVAVYMDFSNSSKWQENIASVPSEIGIVRFDLLQGAYDGLTYDLDYVKFVLADDRILPTIPAETEMALDGDYSVTFTYPQGLNVTEDEIAPDAFGKYAINFEFVGENQIKVYVNPAYAWAGNVVPVKSPGFMNADGTMTYVTTYYNMAFETLGAPTTLNVAQIRTDAEDADKQGMRYAAFIETAAEACEYGYIVTLESSIDDGMGGFGYDMFYIDENVEYNGTAISGTNASGVKIVGAVAITGTGAQTIYSTTGEEFGDYAIDDGLYFTTVLTGIPLTMEGVNTRFVGRPYVKLTDGTYVHGAPITRALIDIANDVIENTEGGMVNCDMYIKNIYMASMGMMG